MKKFDDEWIDLCQNTTISFPHENWLDRWGLFETDWFLNSQNYNDSIETGEG